MCARANSALETKWASLASYGFTVKLLHDVLPIDRTHSAVTVRNHTLEAARRKEQMLGMCQDSESRVVGSQRVRYPSPFRAVS